MPSLPSPSPHVTSSNYQPEIPGLVQQQIQALTAQATWSHLSSNLQPKPKASMNIETTQISSCVRFCTRHISKSSYLPQESHISLRTANHELEFPGLGVHESSLYSRFPKLNSKFIRKLKLPLKHPVKF